jgi:hypothetical protein
MSALPRKNSLLGQAPSGLRLDPTRFISNRRIEGDVRGAVNPRESGRYAKTPPGHPAGVSR